MPWSPKQHRAFAKRCHDPGGVLKASLRKLTQAQACKMAGEGVKKGGKK